MAVGFTLFICNVFFCLFIFIFFTVLGTVRRRWRQWCITCAACGVSSCRQCRPVEPTSSAWSTWASSSSVWLPKVTSLFFLLGAWLVLFELRGLHRRTGWGFCTAVSWCFMPRQLVWLYQGDCIAVSKLVFYAPSTGMVISGRLHSRSKLVFYAQSARTVVSGQLHSKTCDGRPPWWEATLFWNLFL